VLDKSIDTTGATSWRSAAPLDSPAAAMYAERVRAVSLESIGGAVAWAPLFVAHHYTRYLGDLSGGQVMARILARHGYGADELGFYRFDALPGKDGGAAYKDAYRRKLDALGEGLTVQQRRRLLDEVNVAFALNEQIFEECAPTPY